MSVSFRGYEVLGSVLTTIDEDGEFSPLGMFLLEQRHRKGFLFALYPQ